MPGPSLKPAGWHGPATAQPFPHPPPLTWPANSPLRSASQQPSNSPTHPLLLPNPNLTSQFPLLSPHATAAAQARRRMPSRFSRLRLASHGARATPRPRPSSCVTAAPAAFSFQPRRATPSSTQASLLAASRHAPPANLASTGCLFERGGIQRGEGLERLLLASSGSSSRALASSSGP